MNWNVGRFEALANAGKQNQRQRESDSAASAEQQRLKEVVAQADVQQRDAEHGAIGGDQRQVDAQYLMQQGTGLLDHQFRKLHDRGNRYDEGQGAQVFELVRNQQPLIDDITGATGHGQDEGGCSPHACRRLKLLGHSHERAQAKNADEHDVIDEDSAENNEEIAGHDSRTALGAPQLLVEIKLSRL